MAPGKMGAMSVGPPEQQPPPAPADRARAVGRGLGTSAKVTARGVRGAGRASGRFGRYAVGQARRAAGAQGADESGLNRLIYLHAANAAGDAAVAISLATTVFFAGATSEARGQVALFLALTMVPFAIVAPLIGPFLDRFSHGRRWAIGATFAIRGFLCWVLAGAVAADSALLYPAALGVLVSSKAYGVTRAAAIPRLLPAGVTLVKANGRVSLAGLVGAGLSAPLAGAAAYFGAAVVAALCLPRLRGRHRRGDPAAVADRRHRGRAVGVDARHRRRTAPRHPDPGCGGLRAARQLRTAVPLRLPPHVHGVPAARRADRRLGAGRAGGPRDRRRRRRQHPRHPPGLRAQADQPGDHRHRSPSSPTPRSA